MGKKLNIEYIRAEFEKEGYELLTTVYDNNRQKLEYICPNGHQHFINWSDWQQNRRCPCFSNTLKPTIESIRAEFAKEGYTLLTKTYRNCYQKLYYICPEGHKHQISWNKWRDGNRCPYCYGNAKYTIESIRSEFEKEGYELLTTEYRYSKQKLEYICPNGHKHSIKRNSWRRGRRCPYCAGNIKLNIEFIRVEFAKEGYTLLTKVYENAFQKLDYICPKGHKYFITWNNWSHGKRCFYCHGTVKLDIEFIRSEFEKESYTLLTKTYKNNQQKLKYICPKGHKHSISWANWQKGARCPRCSHRISKWEEEVKKFITILNVDYRSNDRKQLINPDTNRPFELDIWFPELNKAIECNGLYWHKKEKAIVRDKIKQQLCKKQGIDLLILTDKEWTDTQEKCKANILSFLESDSKLKQFRSSQ